MKKLQIGNRACNNILGCLQFGNFDNLEELDGRFEDASIESITEMNHILPNLKKIKICCDSSDTVNELLANLRRLEAVAIWGDAWKMPVRKEVAYPSIKHLDLCGFRRDNFCKTNAKRLPTIFPNVETLILDSFGIVATKESLDILLGGLKQLKKLIFTVWDPCIDFDSQHILDYIRRPTTSKIIEKIEINIGDDSPKCLSINTDGDFKIKKMLDGFYFKLFWNSSFVHTMCNFSRN